MTKTTKAPSISLLLTTDRNLTPVAPKSARKGFTLEELYSLLNCRMVEVVRLHRPVEGFKEPILIIDEEGTFDSRNEVNLYASHLAGTRIVGNVILTESKNLK